MGAKKPHINSVANAYEKLARKMFAEGGTTVNQEYAPLAGTMLREGDGRVMAKYNEVRRDLNELSRD